MIKNKFEIQCVIWIFTRLYLLRCELVLSVLFGIFVVYLYFLRVRQCCCDFAYRFMLVTITVCENVVLSQIVNVRIVLC